jgi:peptide chain release factor subunit 3
MDENDQEVYFANAGENVKIQIKNVNYEDIRKGDILCGSQYWAIECQEFVAKITLFELPNEILISKGFEFSLHTHSLVEEGEVAYIFEKQVFDNNTYSTVTIKKPKLLKSFDEAKVVVKMMRPICIEKFEHVPELGRFTIRINQYTIGSGEILMMKPVNKEIIKNNYFFKGK